MKYIRIDKDCIHARTENNDYFAEISRLHSNQIRVNFASWLTPDIEYFKTFHDAKVAIVARVVRQKMEAK